MSARSLYWQTMTHCKGFARHVDNKLKPFYCPLQQRNNHGIYAVNIDANVGFFAQLSWCLYIFSHCQCSNLKPHIILTSPCYSLTPLENWFDYYFENIKLTELDKENIKRNQVTISHVSDIDQLGLPTDPGVQFTIENAQILLNEYVRIKSDILRYVESFVVQHFEGKVVLGIHYRGTDKICEANPVSWDFCAKTISNYLDSNHKFNALFISSDEAGFVAWIETEFKHVEVIHHDDKEYSVDGKAIHVQTSLGNNRVKGEEALVNCLLLSRCNALVRTASFLSAWSSIFNPGLPVVMLNSPYGEKLWFPDDLIIKKSMNGYLPTQGSHMHTDTAPTSSSVLARHE